MYHICPWTNAQGPLNNFPQGNDGEPETFDLSNMDAIQLSEKSKREKKEKKKGKKRQAETMRHVSEMQICQTGNFEMMGPLIGEGCSFKLHVNFKKSSCFQSQF